MKYDIDYRMFEEQFHACTFNINFYSSFSRKIQRTFLSNGPETCLDFKFQISILPFNVSAISLCPCFLVSTFTRASLSVPLSSVEPRKRGERRLEWSTLVSRVLYGGASDYASQRLPRTTLQSRFPWRNSSLPWIVFVL